MSLQVEDISFEESLVIIRDGKGGTYSARRIQQIVKETAEAAGIAKRIYPHLLRHTMATRLVNQGMPIEHVRQVLGHESIDTTRIYAETATRSVQESFDKAVAQSRERSI